MHCILFVSKGTWADHLGAGQGNKGTHSFAQPPHTHAVRWLQPQAVLVCVLLPYQCNGLLMGMSAPLVSATSYSCPQHDSTPSTHTTATRSSSTKCGMSSLPCPAGPAGNRQLPAQQDSDPNQAADTQTMHIWACRHALVVVLPVHPTASSVCARLCVPVLSAYVCMVCRLSSHPRQPGRLSTSAGSSYSFSLRG